MKKVLLALLLLSGINVFAQMVSYGPQISASVTSVNSEDLSSDNSGTAFRYGGFIRVNILILYLQGELAYSQSKFSISTDGLSETDYELSGANATLLVGFKLVPLGKLGNVRVFGGFDWKNASSIDTNNDFNHIALEENNNSLAIGLGVDLWKLTIDYRYLNGMTDLNPGDGSLKLNSSNICVGFKF